MTIAEVAKKYGFTTDTLRYYERVGLLANVRRTPGASGIIRRRIATGWSLSSVCGALAYLYRRWPSIFAFFYEGADTIPKRKALLEGERERILERIGELTAALERLNFKLDGYEERMLAREEKTKIEKPPITGGFFRIFSQKQNMLVCGRREHEKRIDGSPMWVLYYLVKRWVFSPGC